MHALDKIIQQAKKATGVVYLPESTDARILRAARRAQDDGIACPILVGDAARIQEFAASERIALDNIAIKDLNNAINQQLYSEQLFQLRQHKGITKEEALQQAADPLTCALLMLRASGTGGCVAGAAHTTSEVLRAALQLIGKQPDAALVSSFFIMQHDLPHQAIQGSVLYADCAMVIEPDAEQLASIALQTADNARRLLNLTPTVALLSFSTDGSAKHANIDKVKQAGEIVRRQQPDTALMCEVQFDAAVIPEILASKTANISVSPPANVFIFPELQSANIGYKIAERIGGAQAIGPILQGLRQPVNDLSRGCSADDVYNLIAVTAVQGK